jgi:NAD(P)H-dependent flavin oxidoreductase YrpB (nitropropane dioxygenase family)
MPIDAFTTLVGCARPLQLAAMPGINTPPLVEAVCAAGALGMVGLPMHPAPAAAAFLDALAARCRGPFGVNFLMPFLDVDVVDVAAVRAPVLEFFYGEPDGALVRRAAAGGAKVGWQVGSVEEAQAAQEAGCDYVIAQGVEAGGHVRGTLPRQQLLDRVAGIVRVPVVAAGGIGTSQDVAACVAAGACAVRVGTRFVAAAESDAHPRYVQALLQARAEDTVLTEAFSVMWPNAPHRVLASAVAAAHAHEGDSVGETELGPGMSVAVPRFGVPAPTRAATGNIEAMALYAGRSVTAVREILPAAAIVRELLDGVAAAR